MASIMQRKFSFVLSSELGLSLQFCRAQPAGVALGPTLVAIGLNDTPSCKAAVGESLPKGLALLEW